MYDVRELRPGDVVRIVSQWPHEYNRQSTFGSMDKWLGREMTVSAVVTKDLLSKKQRPARDCFVHMIEDREEFCGGGWSWFPEMIDCVVTDAVPIQEHDLPSDDTLSSFLYG